MVKTLFRLAGLAPAFIMIGAAGAAEAVPPLRRAASASGTSVIAQQVSLSRTDALVLVRNALAALNQANMTGNYTVLRDLGSSEFQASNNPSRLADIFRPLRAQAFDLSGIAVIEPQFNEPPQVEKGQLHLAGFFPSTPLQIRFDVTFVGKEQRWVVNSLSVALASSSLGPTPPPVQTTDRR